MGRTSRSAEEIKNIRNQILDAAVRLFFEQGFRNTSVAQVAKAASYSTPTLYKYFENKDALVEGILERLFVAQGDMFDFPVPKGLTTHQLLELLISQMGRWAKKHHQELMFITNNLPKVCPELGNGVNPHQEFIGRLASWLGHHTTKKQRGGLSTELLARTLLAMLHMQVETAIEQGNIETAFEGGDEVLKVLFTKLE